MSTFSKYEVGGDLVLLYDGECPFCSNYVHMLRLREAVGNVVLLDARNGGDFVIKATQQGLNLNTGMALYYGDTWYHGADCMHILAILSARTGRMNRILAWMFRHKIRARLLYPILRFGRNITLRALGRRPIEQ